MGMILWVLCGIGAFVLTILGGAAANQLAQEFRGWTPWLTKKLIKRAVAKLPNTLRQRFREEWASFIADTPGQVAQIVRAFGLSKAANTVAAEYVSGHSFSSLERLSSRFAGLAGWGFFLPLFVFRRLQLLRLLSLRLRAPFEGDAIAVERWTLQLATGAAVLSWSDWRELLRWVAKQFLIRKGQG